MSRLLDLCDSSEMSSSDSEDDDIFNTFVNKARFDIQPVREVAVVAKPIAKAVAKPVAKPPPKPAAKPVAKPIAKPVAKPVVKTATKPVKTIVKPVTRIVVSKTPMSRSGIALISNPKPSWSPNDDNSKIKVTYNKKRKKNEPINFDNIEFFGEDTPEFILGIDVGWRNPGFCKFNTKLEEADEWVWGDLAPGPNDEIPSHQSQLCILVSKYVDAHPKLFEPDYWVVEDQPATKPMNMAVQNALATLAQHMGKQFRVLNPKHVQMSFQDYFVETGHDPNKIAVMKLVKPLLTEKEDKMRTDAIRHQVSMHYTYKPKRYKCEKLGDEVHTWDDMADAWNIAVLVASKMKGKEIHREKQKARGISFAVQRAKKRMTSFS